MIVMALGPLLLHQVLEKMYPAQTLHHSSGAAQFAFFPSCLQLRRADLVRVPSTGGTETCEADLKEAHKDAQRAEALFL